MIVARKKWGSVTWDHLGNHSVQFWDQQLLSYRSSRFSLHFILPFFSLMSFSFSPFTFWFAFCIHPFNERGADGCGGGVVVVVYVYHTSQPMFLEFLFWICLYVKTTPGSKTRTDMCIHQTHRCAMRTDNFWRPRMAPNLCRLVVEYWG